MLPSGKSLIWRGARVATTCAALLSPAVVPAIEPAAQPARPDLSPPRTAAGLMRFPEGALSFGPGAAGPGSGLSITLPGTLPGSRRAPPAAGAPLGFPNRDRAAGVVRFNLKGFSVLEMKEGEGADFRVRRIRNREMRRPLFSISVNKRF